MSLERRQPLPVGRYWIVIVSRPGGASSLDEFRTWCASNPTRIAIETSEPADLATNGAFFIFNVLKPTKFPSGQFGIPNTAGPEIQHASDTVERPPVPQASDVLPDILGPLEQSALMRIALIALLIYGFSKTR